MDRSKPLHNFSLPPRLTWGRQRILRCMNVNPVRTMSAIDDNNESSDSGEYNGNRSVAIHRVELEEFKRSRGGRSSDDSRRKLRFKLPSLSPSQASPAAAEIGSGRQGLTADDEISVTREKLVKDLKAEVGRFRDAILNNNNNASEDEISPVKVYPSSDEAEPNFPAMNSNTHQKLTYVPPPNEIRTDDPPCERKSTRSRRNFEKKEDRPKFSLTLSRREIEEDFIAITGKRPPRKPNKRPKIIQNQIDAIYPGLWLSEVHADRYKVNENGKR